MTGKEIIRALRLCASEESRCAVCNYRHRNRGNCIVQLQKDAADALERLEQAQQNSERNKEEAHHARNPES